MPQISIMRILIWIALLLPVLSNGQEEKLYLDPENAPGAKASVLFSAIELIPLQTTRESYFNNIQEFLVTPYHFIFLDEASNSVLIFDKQGRFIHKYRKKRYKIQSIQYVNSRNALFIRGRNKNYTIPEVKAQEMIHKAKRADYSKYISLELLHLDKEAGFRQEPLPVSRFTLNPTYYMNGKFLVVNGRYNKYINDTVAYHLQLVNGNRIEQSYFPFLNLPRLAPYFDDIGFAIDNTTSDTVFLLQKEFDNTIYRMTPDSLYARYPFVFPADQTMPGEINSMLFKNNIEYTNFKNKNIKAYNSFYNMLEHGPVVFYSATTGNYTRKSFLFNKQNNKLYDLGKVTSDSSIYNMPNRILSMISEQDSEYVYTRISTADLIKERENIISKTPELPEATKKMLLGLDKFDNAIIVRLKITPSTPIQ